MKKDKLKLNTNNAFSDLDPKDVGNFVEKLIKIIQDWLK